MSYYYNSSEYQIREVARKFIRTMNNKLLGVPNFYLYSVDYGCRTYVRDDFSIFLDVNDVENYAETNGISIEGAAKLLISHEIFHIILGHFSDKYKDYDKNLLNIAGDLEINSYLGIGHPGITAADYGWSPLLSTDVYYQKLIELGNKNKEDNEKGFNSFGSDSSRSDKNKNSTNDFDDNIDEDFDENFDEDSDNDFKDEKTDAEKFNDMIEDEYGIDIPEDVVINTATSDHLQEANASINIGTTINNIFNAKKLLKDVAKHCLNEYKNYSLEGLDKIMSKLIRTENEKAIVPHTKKTTYYKLNNRRNSDFILPGKKLEGGATKKKFDKSLTVFIDVSGSTGGTIANNLAKVAYKLYEQGATIVYYNNFVVDVIKPTDAFKKCYASGGTEITKVVTEYMEKYNKLERVYVFTDGQDNFTKMGDVCDKYKIFYVGYKTTNNWQKKLACWEKYSNTNPQKTSQYRW